MKRLSIAHRPLVVALAAVCLLCTLLLLLLYNQPQAVETMTKPVAKTIPPIQDKADIPVKKPVALSQRTVEYHISVALDAQKKQLTGVQTVTWRNPGKLPVHELYFHLYPNAFKSKDSTFMKESGGKLRSDEMKSDSFGRMDVTSIKTVDGESLMARLKYVQPDDGNTKDETLAQLRLPQSVLPGEKVTLHIAFNVKLPSVFARMGYANDFFMAGQWFPKLAAYETDGTRGRKTEGWDLHQYHGNSEFYADFGIYSVRISVPSSYVVAATGFPTKSAAEQNGMKTYTYYADDVHDFAWSASPYFIYKEEKFSSPQVPGVKIKLYLDPQHEHLKDRYFTAAKKALADYSQWFGPYPYSTLSIVVPPEEGNGAGGMEYPTLVTAWGAGNKDPGLELERVVVHEIGHQFWYGMVASNEFEEAWLDEGFTSYAEDKLMEKEYDQYLNTPMEAGYMTSPAPLTQDAWRYLHHGQYADNVYTRGKLVLKTIERQIGSKEMTKVMRTYFYRYRFRHPSTQDFQRTLETVTKRSWDDFFKQFVYNGKMIDYAVKSIQVKKMKQDGKTVYENTVVVEKRNAQASPVPIHFQHADGTSTEQLWDGVEKQKVFQTVTSSPVIWAAIDPYYTMILENKHINNFMKTTIDQKDRTRWSIGTVKLIETLVGWVAW